MVMSLWKERWTFFSEDMFILIKKKKKKSAEGHFLFEKYGSTSIPMQLFLMLSPIS